MATVSFTRDSRTLPSIIDGQFVINILIERIIGTVSEIPEYETWALAM